MKIEIIKKIEICCSGGRIEPTCPTSEPKTKATSCKDVACAVWTYQIRVLYYICQVQTFSKLVPIFFIVNLLSYIVVLHILNFYLNPCIHNFCVSFFFAINFCNILYKSQISHKKLSKLKVEIFKELIKF